MTPEARIVVALKLVDRVRQSIESNGGKYSGAMSPNLTSITDVLTLPDALLKTQSLGAYDSTPGQEEALRVLWEGLS